MRDLKTVLFIFLFSVGSLGAQSWGEKSWIEQTGDVFAYGMPLVSLSSSVVLEDYEGSKQFLAAFGASMGTTYVLKFSVQRERPDGSDTRSFPSGHSAATFQSAVFIHKRYGLKYAALAYAGAAFTAYSRVYAQKHYVSDVLAGAVIGAVSSWFLTTQRLSLRAQIDARQGYGLTVSLKY